MGMSGQQKMQQEESSAQSAPLQHLLSHVDPKLTSE